MSRSTSLSLFSFALLGQLILGSLFASLEAEVVLLNNGNALSGHAVREGDRVVLFAGEGTQLRLDVRDIDYVAADFEDAFRHQAAKCSPRSLEDQVFLIKWAIRHNLYAQATDQLLIARRWHGGARRIVQLEESLHARVVAENAMHETNDNVIQQVSHAEEVRPQVQQAGTGSEFDATKLSNESIAQFTTRIQPLLMNGCATTHCHGRMGESQFSVFTPGPGLPLRPEMTRRNLASALRFVDKKDPLKSILIQKANQVHGRAVRNNENGQLLTDLQMEMLKTFVIESSKNQTRSVPASIRVKLVGHLLQPDNPQTGTGLIDPLQATLGNRHEAPQADPFDPAEFNRRYHAAPAEPAQLIRPLPQ
jgi:hypothetical protein